MRFAHLSIPVVAVSFVVAAVASCGQTGARCTAANCNGCCDSDGVCQTGDAPTACGHGALACVACSAGQVCLAGNCTAGSPQNDGGQTTDAGTDAGAVPSGAGTLWYRGDFTTNNTDQLGRVLPADGGQLTLPFTNEVKAFAVSPDGTKVAVANDSEQVGRFDLWVSNPDGSSPAKLVTMPAFSSASFGIVRSIAFSPSGARIAFEADMDGPGVRDIYVVNVAGGTAQKISPNRPGGQATSTALGPSGFRWSRDSNKVAIVGDYEEDKRLQLYIADVATSTPSTVPAVALSSVPAAPTTGVTGVVAAFEWTAAGRVIFKGMLGSDTGYRLYGVDATGANLGVLPGFPALPAQLGALGVSADGTMVAYSADATVADAYEIYTMPVDGSSAPVRRTSGTVVAGRGPSFFNPIYWSPDGTKLAFIADYAVDTQYEPYVVPASGGTELRLVNIGGSANAGQDADSLAWSLDSTQLALVADHVLNNDGELYLIQNVTTANQEPTLLQDVVVGGDVFDVSWTP